MHHLTLVEVQVQGADYLIEYYPYLRSMLKWTKVVEVVVDCQMKIQVRNEEILVVVHW